MKTEAGIEMDEEILSAITSRCGPGDYLNSLDDIRRAEETLSEFDFGRYCIALRQITNRNVGEVIAEWEYVTATARQRSIALMRSTQPARL